MWEKLTTDYVTHLRAGGYPRTTVSLYGYWLGRAAMELPPPCEVTLGDLERWAAGHDWAPETRKTVRTALRGFFRWAVRTGALNCDPAAGMPAVRVPPAAARPAPEDCFTAALEHMDERVRLAAALAGRMGLRRAEIAAARVEDITDGRLLVRGKGGTSRWVPLHPDVRRRMPDSGPMVPSRYGGHLTPDRVGRLLSDALGEGVSGHMLRHRMATVSYARGGKDLRAVQTILGHRSLQTTQRYVRTDEDALIAAVLAA